MKFIFCILLFIGSFALVFSQTLYVQACGGNTIFLNAPNPIEPFSPTGDLTLMYNARYNTSPLANFFGLFGFKYNYAIQKYNVGYKTYQARINEFLFSFGIGEEIKMGRSSLISSLCLQTGPTYANSDEPYITNSLHILFAGQKPNIREFLQFYLTGGLQYGINLTNRIAIIAGAKMQYYFYEEDLGFLRMKGSNVLFNYAPIKVNPFIGLQVKFWE